MGTTTWKKLGEEEEKQRNLNILSNVKLYSDVMDLTKVLLGVAIREAVLLGMDIQNHRFSKDDARFEEWLNLEIANRVRKILG